MELEPRYIRAVNEKYEVDEFFIDKLKGRITMNTM